ncbi:MAG: aldolase/citrate lyase family protein [Pirellulaceae bacterium]
MTKRSGRSIRQALHTGQRIYATAAIAVSPQWARVLAAANVDFVFVDSEHTPLDRETLAWLCRSYRSEQIPTVVRIPSPDPFEASKVLDGGAAGFIAPYIESPTQVEQLKAVARYRPLKGERAAQAIADSTSLEPELQHYLEDRNGDTLFIINIESVPAIEQLDQILAVGGVDAVLIGPHDLSCSLGIPEQYDHPKFDQAVRHILQTARQHQVGAGIHYWLGIDREIAWAKSTGANLLMHSTDVTLYQNALVQDLNYLRAQLGDANNTDRSASSPVV